MKLTSKGRYAVMALVDLARFDNINPVSLRDISLRQGISLDFLEQIFSKLKKNQIVKSIRGNQGGYILSKDPSEIKLTNIFNAVDEKVKTVQCKKESKKFHVSPFIEMNCKYFFRILNPDEKLSVIIDQYDQEGKILFASQDGKKTDLNSNQLLKSYLKHPLMTIKIISAIHFEAFKLWMKGIKIIKKKIKIRNNMTVEN